MNEKITPPSTDPAEAVAWVEFYYQQGWSDGLPLVPPTEESIQTMLVAGEVEADEIIGTIAERNATIPAEKVAINAVMAGCLAEYFPVVLAAVRCLCRPEFHYHNPATSGSFDMFAAIVGRGSEAAGAGGRHKHQTRRADAAEADCGHGGGHAARPTQTVSGPDSTPARSRPARR